MKDYVNNNIDYGSFESGLIEASSNSSIGQLDIVTGAMIDNIFCDNFNCGIIIGGKRVKKRKHLIIVENYLNSQSSSAKLILTDNDKNYYEFKRNFYAGELHSNKREHFLSSEQKMFYKINLHDCIYRLKNEDFNYSNKYADRFQKQGIEQ